MVSFAIPLGPACATLLVAALSVPTLTQSPEPSPPTDRCWWSVAPMVAACLAQPTRSIQ